MFRRSWVTGLILFAVAGCGSGRSVVTGRVTYDDDSPVQSGTVIAEAPESELITIEGNWYFPPSSVNSDLLVESATPYTCPWKGAAQYWNVSLDGAELTDGAWSYPDLRPGAVDRVGTDFAGYVAFDRKVVVSD